MRRSDRPLITGLEGLHGLVGLLEQVRCQGRVGLPGVPRALHPQPVHDRDQVDEVRTGQVRRTVHQPGPGRDRRVIARLRQPHHHPVRADRRLAGHLVADPRRVQRGQLGMPGGRDDGGRGPQRLPGRPAQQPGCHPRAGSQDDQQAGAVATGDAETAGPAGRATGLGTETTWNWA